MAASAKLAQQAGGAAAGRKYGGSVAPDFLSSDMGGDHELHLKMSKKIAQLTKVIYALNTKNDEHEQVVKAIQQQHEKETQQLLADTRTRLEALRTRLGSETELRRKIEGLELCVDEHEKQRRRLLQDADLSRRESADRETALRAEHAQAITALGRELARVQSDQEASTTSLRQALEAIERDRTDALADMRRAHQIEVEQLLRAAQDAQAAASAADELERERRARADELAAATAAIERERDARRALAAECEQKLDAARELHARELEAARGALSKNADERARLLQEQCDRLARDAQLQEALQRRRVDELTARLVGAEEDGGRLRVELERERAELQAAGGRVTDAERRLSEAKKAAEQLRSLHEKSASELKEANDKCSSQAAEMRTLAARLTESDSLLGAQKARAQRLEEELEASTRKLAGLEFEREDLLSRSHGDAAENSRRISSLEQMLEEARSEVTVLNKQHAAELTQLRADTDKELEQRRTQYEHLLEEVARLKADADGIRTRATEDMDSLEKTWQKRMHELQERYRADTSMLTTDLQTESINLRNKLMVAEAEIQRLSEAWQAASAETQTKASDLSEAHRKLLDLQRQLTSAAAALDAAQMRAAALQAEKEELSAARLQLEEQQRVDLQRALSEQDAQLSSAWADKLRTERERLREELLAQADAERAAHERQLREASERSADALRRRLEARAAELEARVAQLDASLVEQRRSAVAQLDEARAASERRAAELLAERERALAELAARLQAAAEAAAEERDRQAALSREQELKEVTLALKTKHLEDLQAQMAAHRAALSVAQKEAAELRAAEIAAKAEAFGRDLEAAKRELLRAHADEMESVSQGANRQIAAARMELQRAVELKAQKEREFLSTTEEMNAKLNTKEAHIRNMESSVQKYLQNIEQLNKELDAKGKEILKARSDANQQLRKREESLLKEYRAETEKLNSENARRMQQMLEDFNQAQDMLKEKIAALQLMLEEAEERYRNRESRPEDLEAIEHLKGLVSQLEAEMQRLLEEKRYYQMELVNRETNFNKVFSAAPQVGLINPLAKKKKGEKGPTKYSVSSPVIGVPGSMSAGGVNLATNSAQSNGRLRPIAGSPVHDEPLNPNQVLPPPQAFAKRFVQ